MRSELDHAYKLIREGQIAEATAMLERIIRENPNSEDAWWLLANATYAPDAKRNALNNVIRLSQNADRRAKANEMLNELGLDPYSFNGPLPDYKEKSRQLRKGGGFGRIVLIGVALLGVLACAGCFGFFALLMPYLEFPETYTEMGVLEPGEERIATIGEDEIQGYRLSANAGQEIQITIRPLGGDTETPPFIFLFGTDTKLVEVSSDTSINYSRLTTMIPLTGDYIVIVRPVFGFPVGEYSIEATWAD